MLEICRYKKSNSAIEINLPKENAQSIQEMNCIKSVPYKAIIYGCVTVLNQCIKMYYMYNACPALWQAVLGCNTYIKN